MLDQETIDELKKLERRLIKRICCENCLKVQETCEDGQVAVWDEATSAWICGDAGGDSHDPVTLDSGVVTSDGASLLGQEITLNAATEEDYGLVKLEDLVTSIAKQGETALKGDVTLSEGANITLTQVGNDIEIAASGGSPTVTITPTEISSDQDDYSPTDWATATIVRLSFDDSIPAITGFAARADGDRITVYNISGNSGYIPGEHPDSSAANRVITPKDFMIYPYTDFELIYDGTSSRWRIIGSEDESRKTGVFYNWSPGSAIAGDYGYIVSTAHNNGGSVTALAASAPLPNAWQFSTATTSNGGGLAYFAKTSIKYASLGAAHIYTESQISIPTLSDGTETFQTALQIIANPNGSAEIEPSNNDILGIRYSSTINSGKFEFFTQPANIADATADTGITVTAGALYKMRIEIDKAKSEARCYINGSFVARLTTSLPDSVAVGSRVMLEKSAGTTARTLNVHNFSAGAIYK